MSEKDQDLSWAATITIRGCVNVWFKDPYKSHYCWWYPVGHVFGGVPGFTCWYEPPPPGQDHFQGAFCNFRAQGKYSGIQGASGHLDTYPVPCVGNGTANLVGNPTAIPDIVITNYTNSSALGSWAEVGRNESAPAYRLIYDRILGFSEQATKEMRSNL